jgi:hypothetical protein
MRQPVDDEGLPPAVMPPCEVRKALSGQIDENRASAR